MSACGARGGERGGWLTSRILSCAGAGERVSSKSLSGGQGNAYHG